MATSNGTTNGVSASTDSTHLDRLNDKQRRFVAEYLLDLNATQAAIRAGYSEHTANEQGSRLLAHASVSAAVKAGLARKTAVAELSRDMVVEGLLKEALNDGKGSTQAARISAWKLLGQHVGMFREGIDLDLTSKGKAVGQRDTLTADDVRSIAGLLAVAGVGVPSDGGPKPVDQDQPALQAETIPAAG